MPGETTERGPSLGARDALTDALAASLDTRWAEATPRRVNGRVFMSGKVTAVVGMRRAGKTTFVHQLRRERVATGIPRELCPYVSFEDERLADLQPTQLGFLLDEFRRRVPDAAERGRVLWCFDEIQLVPAWERFVRRILDDGRSDVVITGSSAALLSAEVGTALRGRAWSVPLYPFSFAEALDHSGEPIPNTGRMTADERGHVEHEFLRWLDVGGFPEAQDLDLASRRQLLRDYVDVAIFRDVVERHRVTNVQGLRSLVRHLLGNAAGRFSVERFHQGLRSQGIPIARDTVHELLGYLEDCFLVRAIWMEASSERQRMANPRKTYPVDAGLIPLYDRVGRSNVGHALETAVLIELERRRCEVTYVRTPDGHEVDFLARTPAGDEHLVQVCADASHPDTATRELRALREAGATRPTARQWLLTLTRDRLPAEVPKAVTALPAYQWMLSGYGAE
jgi:predicted AAA+ superfamily ATPase